jgi:hypothetical protein
MPTAVPETKVRVKISPYARHVPPAILPQPRLKLLVDEALSY